MAESEPAPSEGGGPSELGPMPPPLPPDWADIDLALCFAEYTTHCREAHLRGEPVAELFRPQRGIGRSSLRPGANP